VIDRGVTHLESVEELIWWLSLSKPYSQRKWKAKAAMTTIESINLIAIDPTIRAGRPYIAGTTLRVSDIVMAHLFHQRTPDEIAADYELALAQVYAALAYYYEHKTLLDYDIRQQLTTARALKEQRPGSTASINYRYI